MTAWYIVEGMENSAIIEKLGSVFASEPNIKLVLIFGSLAKGRLSRDSDIDIAVAASQPLDQSVRMRLIELIAMRTGRPVDLVDLQSASGLILNQALSTGRLLHCSDRNLYASLINRMLIDQEDIMPYHSRILAERRNAWISCIC